MSEHHSEKQLTKLYQQSKRQTKLSSEQKNAILDVAKQQSVSIPSSHWWQRAQFALSLACIGVLGYFVYHQSQAPIPQKLTQVATEHYYQVGLVRLEQQQISVQIAQQKSQLDQSLVQSQNSQLQIAQLVNRKIDNQQLIAVKLIDNQQNWYFESCDGETLLEFEKDVIALLNRANTDLSQIQTGQWLALVLDQQGQLLSLNTEQTELCG